MKFYTHDELKQLSLEDAKIYCSRLRRFLIGQVEKTGGHLASNLGIVEIAVGLMRVFFPPEDKIIYDVGHQSYVHKLLTGRGEQFSTLRSYGGLCGFTRREESPFDPFGAGHSSTSVSAALGMLRAQKIVNGDKKSAVIAVVGDGALSGGMTFEALNNVTPKDKLIVILNDNNMSISPNVGAMSKYFTKVRTSGFYYPLKHKTHSVLSAIPLVGGYLTSALGNTKKNIKKMVYPIALDPFGMYYLGPGDGNDLRVVELLLKEAARREGPVFIHLITKKGKGYSPAEKNPLVFHSITAKSSMSNQNAKTTFSRNFGEVITQLAANNPGICTITAAMAEGCGLTGFAKTYPKRFFDVGIAEAHAMTYAAGLGAGGALPVYAVYSTFFQRCYDQLLHDVALQNLPLLLAIDRAGFCDGDGATHHGLFDVALLSTIPGLVLHAPLTLESQSETLRLAVKNMQKGGGIHGVRYPKGCESSLIQKHFPHYAPASLVGKGETDVLFIVSGQVCEQVLLAYEKLKTEGKNPAVLLLTRLHPLPDLKEVLSPITGVKAIYMVEEGIRNGGVGETLAANRSEWGLPNAPISIFAVDNRFVPHGSRSHLLKHCGLDKDSLYRAALKIK